MTSDGAGTASDDDQALAVAATRILEPDIGTLLHPSDYVRITLDFYEAVFPTQFFWEGGGSQDVAVLFASQFVAGVGRVFVALFGSPHNIRALQLSAIYTGRTPSDARGLYEILRRTIEPEKGDLDVSPRFLPHDLNGEDDLARAAEIAHMAALVVFGLGRPAPARRLQVLAEVGQPADNIHLPPSGSGGPSGDYDRVLVGAPLWAGVPEAEPAPFLVLPELVIERQLWPSLEEVAYQQALDWRTSEKPLSIPDDLASPTDTVWTAFAGWFVDFAIRAGQTERDMMGDRRKGFVEYVQGLLRGSRNDGHKEVALGPAGVTVSQAGRRDRLYSRAPQDHLLVCRDGNVFEVSQWEDGSVYYQPPSGAPHELGPREEPESISSERRLEMVPLMWGHVVLWRTRPHWGVWD